MNTNNGFWQTDRGKALIKLLLWMVFIVILIVLVIVSERNANSEILDVDKPENNVTDTPSEPENVEYEAYNTMITNLLANNYEYEYLITTATDSIILTGFNRYVNSDFNFLRRIYKKFKSPCLFASDFVELRVVLLYNLFDAARRALHFCLLRAAAP